MRNPLGFVTRLSFVISNSSIRPAGKHLLRKFATSQEKPLKRRSKKFAHNLSESVSEAIETIRLNRSVMSAGKMLYLVDESVAKKFASLVIANRSTENSSHVIEINPGLGYLTTELLDSGLSSIHVFEGIKDFVPNLNSLCEKYGDRVYLEMTDFYQLWNIAYMDWKENSDKLSTYFESVVKRSWQEGPAIELIGSLADINFIHRLVGTVTFKTFLSRYGRMVLYVAVPPSILATLTCSNEHYDLYRARIVMFQTLFNCELLGSLPRTAFIPAYKQSRKKRRNKCRQKIEENDVNTMHLVKIEPKPDVLKDDFTPADLVTFNYFVKHHLKSRSDRVIPAMEHWVPGCGRILIAQGYNIFTEFGELTPEEILKLFNEFRSWPEYKKSGFASFMNSFSIDMEEQNLFDGNTGEMDNLFELPVDQDGTLIE